MRVHQTKRDAAGNVAEDTAQDQSINVHPEKVC